ncbi:hypothetical protein [Lacinutrix sp. MEBiC02404]
MEKLSEKQLLVARQEFRPYLTSGSKTLSKLKLKTPLSAFKQQLNTTFESLGCVGYNAVKKQLTATVNIKRATGYSGDLCANGSHEYVRFYLDYQDGAGWEDMGVVGLNVHDIPTKKDCQGENEKPMSYVVRLNINPKKKYCTIPNLPLVRAVLAWNTIPEPNDPNLTKGTYVWSDKKDARIQIAPLQFFIPNFPVLEIDELLHAAILNPNLSLNTIAFDKPEHISALQKAKHTIIPKDLPFNALVNLYAKDKIEPYRFGYKLLDKIQNTAFTNNVSDISNLFEMNNISLSDSLIHLNTLNCNTNYEELVCVGADYNREALVGTVKVKKSSGYSGSLCSSGSKEYVSFWVQTEENCEWVHAGTSSVAVYDIDDMPSEGLFYSVVLPYNFQDLKRNCNTPNVLKVRAVLSWNVPPTDRNCSNWGNIVESYIQLKPRDAWHGIGPKLTVIGGVRVEDIGNDGLTKPGIFFDYYDTPVPYDNCAFARLIMVEAKTNAFAGQKYKIRIDNLTTGESNYLNKSFKLDDNSESIANAANEYTYYGDATNNENNIVARFYPGNNDLLRITLEHLDGSTPDSQVIQMDNTIPGLTLDIINYGECSHFVKGSPISGSFSVEETHLEEFHLHTSLTDASSFTVASGTASISDEPFTVATSSTKNCGEITLTAKHRVILDSQRIYPAIHIRKIVCLKDVV